MIAGLLIVASVAAATPAAPSLGDAAHAISAGRLDEARLIIGKLVAAGARGSQVDRLLADLSYASGRYSEASARYRQLLLASPNDTYLCEHAGISAVQISDLTGATPLLACATAASNASWRAWNARGVLADLKGDWADADASFEHALASAPNQPEVLNNRGWSQLMRGDWQGAEQLFEQAVAAHPNSPRIANNLELARAALANDLPKRRPDESERDWSARLNDVGVASEVLGDRKKAIAAFTQALEASGSWYERAANNLEAAQHGK